MYVIHQNYKNIDHSIQCDVPRMSLLTSLFFNQTADMPTSSSYGDKSAN